MEWGKCKLSWGWPFDSHHSIHTVVYQLFYGWQPLSLPMTYLLHPIVFIYHYVWFTQHHWDHHSTINLLPSLFTNQIMTLCISLTFGFVHWFCRSLLIENGGCLISSDDLCLSPLICLSPLHPGVCHEQDLPRLHANTHHQPVHFHPLHTQMENGWQGWGIKWYKENTVAMYTHMIQSQTTWLLCIC